MGAVLHAAIQYERERGHRSYAQHSRKFVTDKARILLYGFKGGKLFSSDVS